VDLHLWTDNDIIGSDDPRQHEIRPGTELLYKKQCAVTNRTAASSIARCASCGVNSKRRRGRYPAPITLRV